MRAIARNWRWIAATLAVAVAVHLASVAYLPHVIMDRVIAGIGRAGMGVMHHGTRPDANSRAVVRPSPDLLYSTCAYDLAAGPLQVRARGMPKTYWSISLFDADTDNFYVLDDAQAKDGAADFILVPAGQDKPPPGRVVRSPTQRGLVLVRTLIDDDAHLSEIDRARRGATCAPLDKK